MCLFISTTCHYDSAVITQTLQESNQLLGHSVSRTHTPIYVVRNVLELLLVLPIILPFLSWTSSHCYPRPFGPLDWRQPRHHCRTSPQSQKPINSAIGLLSSVQIKCLVRASVHLRQHQEEMLSTKNRLLICLLSACVTSCSAFQPSHAALLACKCSWE